jgi:hypothetical protein
LIDLPWAFWRREEARRQMEVEALDLAIFTRRSRGLVIED